MISRVQVRVSKQCEPMRRKSLWDYLLDEAMWMASDVRVFLVSTSTFDPPAPLCI